MDPASIWRTGGAGTEPKARLLLEGRDAKVLEKWSKQICGAIQKQIGL
jgi:phosphomannomutase